MISNQSDPLEYASSCLWNIFRAIYNHGLRAVICKYGVAYVRPSSSDSFRWQDFLAGVRTIIAASMATARPRILDLLRPFLGAYDFCSEHGDRKGSPLLYTPGARSACIVVTTLAVAMQKSYAYPVLTTFHRVNVYTFHSQSSEATTTSVRHTYTVHCHDGRKFVFKLPLARVQDLGESIEVQVARMKQCMSQG